MNETVTLRENLRDAMNDQAQTANGGRTLASSLNKNVDLFFLAGASRGKDITPQFMAAFNEDSEVALRILQWARDVRGGAGERETFRTLFRSLLEARSLTVGRAVLQKVPEIGRWDDVLVAFGTALENDALQMIAKALVTDQNGLAAKWMPRKGADANKIRAYLKLTPKNYRKLLVGLSETVEQKMCAKEWNEIEYGKLPSVASARYQKAFGRNDADRYGSYLEALKKGEEKINAGAVYPYDIVKSLRFGDSTAATEQWKALPDYLEGSDESILPVVDVSGSMTSNKAGGSKNLTCMDAAVSLGLYISERNEGVFKDTFITFSNAPQMVTVSGNLKQRMEQMLRSEWGMNTNIQAVFETILSAAVKHKVPESGMPTMLLILSDMEFDTCVSVGKAKKNTWGYDMPATGASEVVTAMEMIEQRYADAGYKVPQIVFWNLNGRAGNVPVEYNKAGAALVSGFSPAIMTSLLGGEEMSPQAIMLKTVMVDRYAI
jgi:hypothetical protein